MVKENDGYLTIGEMAKITGINAKCLRYYDQIGILCPIKTDSKTGYRYYSPSQIHQVTAVRFCIEAGIPLKSFFQYDLQDVNSIKTLLDDAAWLAEENLRQLQKRQLFIENAKRAVTRNEELLQTGDPIRYKTAAQKYLTHPILQDMDTDALNKAFCVIHVKAAELGWHMGCHYGKLYMFDLNTKEVVRMAFIDVLEGEGDTEESLSFPETQYTARRFFESRIEEAAQIFPELFSEAALLWVFESQLTHSAKCVSRLYELRCTGQAAVGKQTACCRGN